MSEKCECGHKRTSHVMPGETVTGIICYGTGCDCPGYANEAAALDVAGVGEAVEVRMARRMHDIYERLAPEFGYETRTETREFDPESKNGRLMTATVKRFAQVLASEFAALTPRDEPAATTDGTLEAPDD